MSGASGGGAGSVESRSGASNALERALERVSGLGPQGIHRLQVGLAELVLSQAPPGARAQLELARSFIEGRAQPAALREAQQDCWSDVGSLACGCSASDSASAHAILTCLETQPLAHASGALAEQAERILRCGVSEATIIAVLAGARLV